MSEPFGPELTSIRSPKVKAARQLAKRALRLRARSFLAEGPQAVREALARGGVVSQLFITGAARARHADSPDAYWTWVAERQRWMRPWDTVRTGGLGDFSYFAGGQINVADNCVDRWAQDPATAGRAAATATGDLLFSRAFAELAGGGSPDAVQVLARASRELAMGELTQREDAYRLDVSVDR